MIKRMKKKEKNKDFFRRKKILKIKVEVYMVNLCSQTRLTVFQSRSDGSDVHILTR